MAPEDVGSLDQGTRKDWVKASSELAQERQAWSDTVNSIGSAGSTRPG